MRTTIELPDSLWEKAKHRAVAEKTSLAKVIEKALRAYLGEKRA